MSDLSAPLVTVVIPAMNASSWIGETLASVIAQTYPKDRLEVVVVDDGSVDGTADVAGRSLMSSGLVHAVLRNASPLGPSAARNRGWRHGQGEWIQFLDADDLLASTKISKQVDALFTTPASVSGLFSPWARLHIVADQWIPIHPIQQPDIGSDPLLDLLAPDNFLQLGCLLLSRRWLDRVNGFDESHRLIEDVDLLLRMVIAGGSFTSVPAAAPLSFYRMRHDSLSRSSDRGFVDGCVRNGRLAEDYWRDRSELTPSRGAVLADLYFWAARYYAEEDRETFHAIVRDIYRLNPRFVPKTPRSLRLLSELVGYRAAEWCAVRRRQLKRVIYGSPGRAKKHQELEEAVRR